LAYILIACTVLKITPIIATIVSLCAISFLVYGNSAVNFTVYAQSYLQTIKYRNLVIDLGIGVKTSAQLTYPAVGKGPFPGVLLIHGSGANDKNETLGHVYKNGPKPPEAIAAPNPWTILATIKTISEGARPPVNEAREKSRTPMINNFL
jgi:hypothetical protein